MTSLLLRLRLIRALAEPLQAALRDVTRDTKLRHQTARLMDSPVADATKTALGEMIGAEIEMARAMGCIDDALSGLETAGIIEAHPNATEDEFQALLSGLG